MKYKILFLLWLPLFCCKSKEKQKKDYCISCNATPLPGIELDYTQNNFDSMAYKILKNIKADTAYFFSSYTSAENICAVIGCNEKIFDKILYTDACGLLLLKTNDSIKFHFICDSNLLLTKNAIFPPR
jgi:hypothetical protein